MSFFSKIFGKKPPEPAPVVATTPEPPPAPVATEPEATELDRLVDPRTPTGDAVAIFRALRSTPDEGKAIDEVLRATGSRTLPEELLFVVASALVDRGQRANALALLAKCNSPGALLLRADLAAESSDPASQAAALALVERILLADYDHPGARERLRRLREALGLAVERKPDAQTTTVVAAEPETPYRLLREAARGGAGAVYEAEDRELGRRIALKVYHEPTRDRAQLLNEVRTAVALRGRGVVRIFDVDEAHGWIALEWLALGSLRERIRAGDESVLRATRTWALPLARALARVHARGFVHLDVKPANVLLRSPDDAVLTDFGIARPRGEPSPAGSMGYVSPERMAGSTADPKDDVFGFGRILEDVLDRFGGEDFARALATRCTGPASERPADANELAALLAG
jgi:serine/threonine-protein kinase